ncbi:MAG: hypothetical protein ACXW27_05640 [Allosphingosinicella sp.]
MLSIKSPLAFLCIAAVAAPGAAAPARDSRDYVVVSNPVVAPPNFNGAAKGEPPKVVPSTTLLDGPGQVVVTGTKGNFSWPGSDTPPPPPPPSQGRATANPRPCTRVVTDGCVQAYERRSVPIRQDFRIGD